MNQEAKHSADGHCLKCNPNTYTRCLVIFTQTFSLVPALFDRFGAETPDGQKIIGEVQQAIEPIVKRLMRAGHNPVEVYHIIECGLPWIQFEIERLRQKMNAVRVVNGELPVYETWPSAKD